MINDQERHAVAARLRALDAHEWSDFMDEVDSLETAIGCSIGQDWQDQDWWHRLADLIEPEPERTCTAEEIPYMPGCYEGNWCSVCHCIDFESDEPNYCPQCGAKVVDDD